MPDVITREEIELRLRAELAETHRQMRDADPDEVLEAKRHYRQALRAFARLVVDGIAPDEYGQA